MKPPLSPRAVLALLAPCCALLLACGGSVTTPWDTVPQKTGSAVAKEAKEGSEFNKFFPKGGEGWDVTYTQEKKGFASASLKKDGKEVATLAVFDVLSNPEVPKDYENSTEKIDRLHFFHVIHGLGRKGDARQRQQDPGDSEKSNHGRLRQDI